MIRKIQFAPASNKAGPKADIAKQFMMTDKPLNVEASLEKEVHQRLQTQFSAWYIRYKHCSSTHKESFLHLDLLPRRADHREGKGQQRNQQGCEENQNLRWAVRSLGLNS